MDPLVRPPALGLHSVGVNALVGERFLAVDPDAAVVYTLADEQQGSIALNGSMETGGPDEPHAAGGI